jgi:hypothetical protein
MLNDLKKNDKLKKEKMWNIFSNNRKAGNIDFGKGNFFFQSEKITWAASCNGVQPE